MQEHKTTKLVQANTIARSSSAILEQRGSSRSSRLARLARQSRTCRVESSRAKWNFGLESARPPINPPLIVYLLLQPSYDRLNIVELTYLITSYNLNFHVNF